MLIKLLLIVNSLKLKLLNFINLIPEKLKLSIIGLEINNRNSFIMQKRFKHKFGLPNKKMILFVGRINDPRKGLEPLLCSF